MQEENQKIVEIRKGEEDTKNVNTHSVVIAQPKPKKKYSKTVWWLFDKRLFGLIFLLRWFVRSLV